MVRLSGSGTGDLGVYGRNSGKFEVVDHLLLLDPVDEEVTFLGGRRFVPVRWGERLYLIPTATIERFRDRIVRGKEPRIGVDSGSSRFYLRKPDWDKPVMDVPIAPPRWQDHFRRLSPKRVEATVTGLRSETYKYLVSHYASLDRGAKDGLKQGMWLTMPPSPGDELGTHVPRLFAVNAVQQNSSEARIIISGGVPAGTPHGVKVGDVASVSFCIAEPEPAPRLSSKEKKAREQARTLINEVVHTYATCKSYKDEGLVRMVFVKEGGGGDAFKHHSRLGSLGQTNSDSNSATARTETTHAVASVGKRVVRCANGIGISR